MNISNQLLFFFSALGAFNGLFLSLYFAFFIKKKSRSTYFLAALIFVLSVRVGKSVFLTFYPGTSDVFIQIGLTACFLIGPFLYIYVSETKKTKTSNKYLWLLHIIPVIILMIFISYYYPYREYRYIWWKTPVRFMGGLLLTQWTTYIILSFIKISDSLEKLFSKKEKMNNQDFWLVNVVVGVSIIWLAYNTSRYTSYIVGALSFSFTFYLTILIWILKRRKSSVFFEKPTKYTKARINENDVNAISKKLSHLFTEKDLYKNPQLKLKDIATEIDVTSHMLSEYLNNNLGKSFSIFINEFRVEEAAKMLQENDQLTLEAIGQDCGFKSNSTFYTAFKRKYHVTPSQYKKIHFSS